MQQNELLEEIRLALSAILECGLSLLDNVGVFEEIGITSEELTPGFPDTFVGAGDGWTLQMAFVSALISCVFYGTDKNEQIVGEITGV